MPVKRIKEFIKSALINFIENNIGNGKYAILLSIFVLILLRVAINVVFYLINSFDSFSFDLINYFHSVILIVTLVIFEYQKLKNTISKIKQKKEQFFKEYIRISVVVVLIMLLIMLFVENNSRLVYNTNTLSYITTIDIFSIIAAYIFTKMMSFVYKWLILFKNKYTESIILVLIILALLSYVITLIEIIFNQQIMSSTVNVIIYLTIFILIFSITNNFRWLATLTTSKKNILLVTTSVTLLILFIGFFSIQQVIQVRQDINYLVINYNYRMFLMLAAIVFIAYSIKLFFVLIVSLPTAKIIDKQTDEINLISNSYKNIISIRTDFNLLLKKILHDTKVATEATAAWCELYKKNSAKKHVEVPFFEGIDVELIYKLHKNSKLKEMLYDIEEPTVIETVPTSSYWRFFVKFIPEANSVAIIPIISNKRRIGTLILIDKKEYKFNEESLVLMNTLFDIMNVVYNNVKMRIESIEMHKELELGQKIQAQLLPLSCPDFPSYSIDVHSKSSKEVGGDYYDFVKLADGRSCIIIGDVSGKGITAAFIMAYIKGIVTSLAPLANSPKELLVLINSAFEINQIDRKLFVTMLAVRIDDDDGNITFARAGHTPLLAKLSNSCQFYQPAGLGIGLINNGIARDFSFADKIEEFTLKMNKNDFCVLFTDGLNELRNEKNEEYGLENFKNFISNLEVNEENIASEVNSLIINELERYSEMAEQRDDLTILTFSFNGK